MRNKKSATNKYTFMAVYVYLNSYLYWCFLFLPFDLSYCPVILFFFFFSLKDTLQSKSVGKCFSKPLNFVSCGTVLISSCLKDSFTGYRILGLESSYSTLNMSFFCLPWFLMTSQLGIILRILCIWCFPQFFQISLFVFVFQKFDCDVPRCGYLSLSCLELARFLDVYIVYFPSELGIFVHYFFKYYFRPFLTFFSLCGFCYAYITVFCGFSQISEIHFIFISIFSLFLRLNNFSWPVKFTWFFLLPLQICAELL